MSASLHSKLAEAAQEAGQARAALGQLQEAASATLHAAAGASGGAPSPALSSALERLQSVVAEHSTMPLAPGALVSTCTSPPTNAPQPPGLAPPQRSPPGHVLNGSSGSIDEPSVLDPPSCLDLSATGRFGQQFGDHASTSYAPSPVNRVPDTPPHTHGRRRGLSLGGGREITATGDSVSEASTVAGRPRAPSTPARTPTSRALHFGAPGELGRSAPVQGGAFSPPHAWGAGGALHADMTNRRRGSASSGLVEVARSLTHDGAFEGRDLTQDSMDGVDTASLQANRKCHLRGSKKRSLHPSSDDCDGDTRDTLSPRALGATCGSPLASPLGIHSAGPHGRSWADGTGPESSGHSVAGASTGGDVGGALHCGSSVSTPRADSDSGECDLSAAAHAASQRPAKVQRGGTSPTPACNSGPSHQPAVAGAGRWGLPVPFPVPRAADPNDLQAASTRSTSSPPSLQDSGIVTDGEEEGRDVEVAEAIGVSDESAGVTPRIRLPPRNRALPPISAPGAQNVSGDISGALISTPTPHGPGVTADRHSALHTPQPRSDALSSSPSALARRGRGSPVLPLPPDTAERFRHILATPSSLPPPRISAGRVGGGPIGGEHLPLTHTHAPATAPPNLSARQLVGAQRPLQGMPTAVAAAAADPVSTVLHFSPTPGRGRKSA